MPAFFLGLLKCSVTLSSCKVGVLTYDLYAPVPTSCFSRHRTFFLRRGFLKRRKDLRKIGLDVGDKTIGVAVSDELLIAANGITTIERVGIRKDCSKVMDYIKEYDCDTVVMGLPLRLDGTDSPQTEKVREFRTMLENKMRSTGMAHVEIVFQDERLTTVQAERVLIEADLSRKKRKEVIDKQAAVLILQSYLDSLAFKR